jgi:CDP-diacylglycerol--serine O-phosphatidyltransferase
MFRKKSMRRRIRAVHVLPTLFTLGNLVCGFFAIMVVAWDDPPMPAGPFGGPDPTYAMIAAALIFLAMVFDALDGQLARLARSTSEFGAQLDSLCDVVSFGVAPAFLLVKMCPDFAVGHPHAIWVIAAAFVVCAALRLARFNVETTAADSHLSFRGLPSPAAAAAVASFAFLFHALRTGTPPLAYAPEIDDAVRWLLPFFALAVALLMVSRVRYPHLTNQMLKGKRSLRHVVGIVFALAIVALVRGYAMPVICGLFVLTGPWGLVRAAIARRRAPRVEQLLPEGEPDKPPPEKRTM